MIIANTVEDLHVLRRGVRMRMNVTSPTRYTLHCNVLSIIMNELINY